MFTGVRPAALVVVWFVIYAFVGTIRDMCNHGQVKLGLLPGWGGTQLLHPVVGLQAALDMILTGEPLFSKESVMFSSLGRTPHPQSYTPSASLRVLGGRTQIYLSLPNLP